MNKPIRILAVGCMVLFVALLGRATYVQYFHAGELTSLSAHPNNVRVRDAQYSRERGAIVVQGPDKRRAIAVSRKSHDQYKYLREYPEGREFAHITGYFSRDYGLMGIESSQNDVLSGNDSSLFLNRVIDLVDHQNPKGGSVTLTLNAAAQKAAFDGLKKLNQHVQGAVVALEPSTGRVLAMVSTPSYDPNRLASHHFDKVGKIKQHLLERDPSPLDNIAIETLVPPGSTFKIITTAAALASGKFTPKSQVPGASSMKLPLSSHILHNENNIPCGSGTVTLTVALERSCNVAFGTVGEKLGADRLKSMAHKFGFGETYFHDLDDSLTRQAQSRFPDNADAPQTVLAAIGQGDVAATPLQMAMVAAGIANHGTVMKPYLVDETLSPDLDVLSKTKPEALDGQPAVSPEVAREVTRMMVAVVDNGTGTPAQIPGIAVAGKTGTAQSAASRPPYAWFVSFAPAQNPQVAVAVLIQDAGVARDAISGSGLAAPTAKAVMEAVLNR
ncbi:MAG TPA: penicillin-binding protein 2 [Nocardioidaceae bacterium]|nr:penicillin-binding protein 2 [Nocardioidaceae bacterium]